MIRLANVPQSLLLAATALVVVFGGVMEVSQFLAERSCMTKGYQTTKTVGFSTWCSKVENGTTVTVKVR